MRRQTQQQVEEAARRRLDLLARELEQAGLRRIEPAGTATDTPNAEQPGEPAGSDDDAAPPPGTPARLSDAGRHRRRPRTALSGRAAGWMSDQVPETLRGRVGLSAGPAALLVGLVALAVVAAAYAFLRAGAESEPVPAGSAAPVTPLVSPSAVPGAVRSGPAAGAGTASPSAPGGGAAAASVTVDIAGKVRRPGVTTLPQGSRVVDALAAAGGAKPRVDLSSLNLARVLVDGEQIVVGQPSRPGGIAASVASGAPAPAGALVNLNTATQEQLETLPGVGPVTAQKIMDWRASHGTFSSVDELLEIDGIGEKTLAEIAPHATL